MSKIILVDKDKRWADTPDRLATIREEITELLLEAGHSISKPLIDDVAVIILNKQIDAFYAKDLGKLK